MVSVYLLTVKGALQPLVGVAESVIAAMAYWYMLRIQITWYLTIPIPYHSVLIDNNTLSLYLSNSLLIAIHSQ